MVTVCYCLSHAVGTADMKYDLISQGASACPDEDDEESLVLVTLPMQAHHAMEKMEEFVHKVTSSAILKVFY